MGGTVQLKIYTRADLSIQSRANETKLGETVQLLPESSSADNLPLRLKAAYASGARYALLGVSEDIGPRANCGKEGAEEVWEAFLEQFANVQSNRFLDGKDVLVLGHVDLDDILEKADVLHNENPDDLAALRLLCNDVDDRVYPAIHAIVSAGMTPIVIGGGHNNAYPIIKATSDALLARGAIKQKGIATLNCDPHGDFRPLEGRHSGNPFSYAFSEGHLTAYYVVGLHDGANSETLLRRITEANGDGREAPRVGYARFEDTICGNYTFDDLVRRGLDFLSRFDLPLGLELDLDSIASMAVSAKTTSGISVDDARRYVARVAQARKTEYLHIAEGAPMQAQDGRFQVGRTAALLVADYVKMYGTRMRALSSNS